MTLTTVEREAIRQRPLRSPPPRIPTVQRVPSRRVGASAGEGRSAVSGSSASRVFATSAPSTRSASSSSVSRPSPAAARRRSTVRSRSASDARSGPGGCASEAMPPVYQDLRLAVSKRAAAFACLRGRDREDDDSPPRPRGRGARRRRGLPGAQRRRGSLDRPPSSFVDALERRRRRRGRAADRRSEGGGGRPEGEPPRPRRRERQGDPGRAEGVGRRGHGEADAAVADPADRRLGLRLDAPPAQGRGRVARQLVAEDGPPEARRRDPARDHRRAEGARGDPRPRRAGR